MGIEPVELLENRELHRLLVESAQRRFIAHGICNSGSIVHWTLRVSDAEDQRECEEDASDEPSARIYRRQHSRSSVRRGGRLPRRRWNPTMLRLPRRSTYSPRSNGWPNWQQKGILSPEEFAAKRPSFCLGCESNAPVVRAASAFISDQLWPVRQAL